MYNKSLSQPSKIKNSLSFFFFFFWKNLLTESIEITINSLPSKFFKTAVSLGQNAMSYLIEILNFLFNFKIKLRKINISMR
jgi:hypothetical protein